MENIHIWLYVFRSCYIPVVLYDGLRNMAIANQHLVHMRAVFLSGLRSPRQEQR